jgi:hypothetical protein
MTPWNSPVPVATGLVVHDRLRDGLPRQGDDLDVAALEHLLRVVGDGHVEHDEGLACTVGGLLAGRHRAGVGHGYLHAVGVGNRLAEAGAPVGRGDAQLAPLIARSTVPSGSPSGSVTGGGAVSCAVSVLGDGPQGRSLHVGLPGLLRYGYGYGEDDR